ncbi:type VII secretion protein EccE [Saccharopolyspora sp. NPDC050389]|uniref:type VII secretion protein EccE n=1 Tax=Saccharopolyspora sp. NPDC050389 TaxID=3155516 RepID=UPI0033F1ACA8
MTDPGATRAGVRIDAPAIPQPRATPVWQPAMTAHPAATADASFAAQPVGRQPQSAVAAAARQVEARRRAMPARPLGGIGVLQVIYWQLVLIAVVLVIGRPWPAIAAVVVVAAMILALTAVRVRGRWLYEWLALSSKYLLRKRDRDLRNADEAGRALLRLISPEAVWIVDDVGDETVSMVSRAAGIAAVLQPRSTTRAPKPMPPPEMMLPPLNEQAPAFAVQVVHHAGFSQAHAPRVWLTLQVLRTVEVHRDADVQRALGNAVRRVKRQLRRDGTPTRGLTENDVLGAISSLAHVTADRGRIREQWRLWHAGPVSQATFELGGWAGLSPTVATQALHRLLTAAPHSALTIAVTARRSTTETEPQVDATLRIAAANLPALEHTTQALTRLAREWGIGMKRLDGRHVQGVAATLPIGLSDARQHR